LFPFGKRQVTVRIEATTGALLPVISTAGSATISPERSVRSELLSSLSIPFVRDRMVPNMGMQRFVLIELDRDVISLFGSEKELRPAHFDSIEL
jgi:hypothetical protein